MLSASGAAAACACNRVLLPQLVHKDRSVSGPSWVPPYSQLCLQLGEDTALGCEPKLVTGHSDQSP
eukprot:NODE_7549_length_315_cov_45.563910_g6811_i0.p2 GENE.NODE_7549_length_315_cov_45.563910_g6811_i0~~NODE_7549_length_315_cov_45.563910_g6811_i0.p2  ORF type:complete len:66 (+),score=11.42 NODE_7549_length_315_cov_45.563910_g6811_i0:47-244(+)